MTLLQVLAFGEDLYKVLASSGILVFWFCGQHFMWNDAYRTERVDAKWLPAQPAAVLPRRLHNADEDTRWRRLAHISVCSCVVNFARPVTRYYLQIGLNCDSALFVSFCPPPPTRKYVGVVSEINSRPLPYALPLIRYSLNISFSILK